VSPRDADRVRPARHPARWPCSMQLAGQVRVFGVGGGSPGGVLLRGFGPVSVALGADEHHGGPGLRLTVRGCRFPTDQHSVRRRLFASQRSRPK
jgi:hypothetical protein